LVYLDPGWDDAEYEAFYENEYRALLERHHGKQDIRKNQQRYGAALGKFLAGLVNPKVRSILDIGGSTGIVAKRVSEALGGASAIVVDPNPDEVREARANVHDALVGTIADVEHFESDLVLLCRTIDHISRPIDYLKKIARIIGQEGVAYIDFSDWLFVARDQGVTNALHVDHPSNFTQGSFLVALARAGLKPIAEFIPPLSTCHGYVVEAGSGFDTSPWCKRRDVFGEIRKLQSEERKSWRESAY
jgi:SAM-dependent methyltransferase